MLHANRTRAESFGADAERYHRVRPRYPAALLDALVSPATRTVLDVGCGTGIVSGLFRDHGCAVVGVEPDERMAQVAREQDLTVETSAFEDWNPAGRTFDLVVCGQAWHWIDPARGPAKAADALRADGRIAIFWNLGAPASDVRDALAPAYAGIAPELAETSVLLGTADRLDGAEASLTAGDRFTRPTRRSWTWDRRYSADEWIEHLSTHSDHAVLPEDRREALFAALRKRIAVLGGGFTMTYSTGLVTARTVAAD
jgi:SAM-dependent methyltransferase